MRSNKRNNSKRADDPGWQNIAIQIYQHRIESKYPRTKKKRTHTQPYTQNDKSNEQCAIKSVTRPIKWNKINNEYTHTERERKKSKFSGFKSKCRANRRS